MSARHVQELVERYLDPTARWGRAEDSAMRGHLRECADCQTYYGRRVALHRGLLGADLEAPSGFERQRMAGALLDEVAPPRRWAQWAWVPLVLAGAAATFLFSVRPVVPIPSPATPDEYVGARGGPKDAVTVGIGLSGVVDGREYEVVEEALYLDDELLITTSREVENPDHVFIVGFQNGKAPIYYWPDPDNGETQSMEVPLERSAALKKDGTSIQFELKGTHVPGRLVVVALFTDEPLGVAQVQDALSGWTLEETARPEAVAERLVKALPQAVIRSVAVDVLPGSRRDARQ